MTKPRVMMAIQNAEIEAFIRSLEVDIIEATEDIDIINDVLEYEPADFIIVNTLLSQEKTIKLAGSVKALNVEIRMIALVADFKDQKFMAHLAAMDVNAFASLDELHKIKRYMEQYPETFDFTLLTGNERIIKNATETRLSTGTVSIGVFNVCAGAGATTFVLQLAEAISNCGYRVVCPSLAGDCSFRHLPSKLCAEYIDVVDGKLKEAILQLAYSRKDYQFLIIDFGHVYDINADGHLRAARQNDLDDFLRCNYKIGFAFAEKYQREKLQYFKQNIFADEMGNDQLHFIVSGEDVQEVIDEYPEWSIYDRDTLSDYLEKLKLELGLIQQPQRLGIFGKIMRRK